MKNLKHLQQFKGNPHKKQGGWVAIAALIISGVGMSQSHDANIAAANEREKQAQAERDAREASARSAEVSAQKERIKQQREARISRAKVLSAAQASGVAASSSGVVGATGSISSQEATNIGSINVAQDFASAASAANQRAATAQGNIANIQATAQQWQMITSTFGAGKSSWNKVFGPDVKKAGTP
ncbi:MAG: hypothetical protein WC471_06045 [Candidatus Woesearchaeota archaeon]